MLELNNANFNKLCLYTNITWPFFSLCAPIAVVLRNRNSIVREYNVATACCKELFYVLVLCTVSIISNHRKKKARKSKRDRNAISCNALRNALCILYILNLRDKWYNTHFTFIRICKCYNADDFWKFHLLRKNMILKNFRFEKIL